MDVIGFIGCIAVGIFLLIGGIICITELFEHTGKIKDLLARISALEGKVRDLEDVASPADWEIQEIIAALDAPEPDEADVEKVRRATRVLKALRGA